ncbi:hypothetical protein DAPPUDRAFT_322861 [Daphnia pulex]|uniref:Uncharacterized protein n=1 Tax=Daphnia pulex TaxID=6669 RepID=E9GX53_DAPPU|nr:hypothetical protein DAPPUDRAFT_322861 [Daphnia pulex]|eukprot:EFX75814.1 hypothetical protein DAPPUDRAFT_322861 [Daphnia pulex]
MSEESTKKTAVQRKRECGVYQQLNDNHSKKRRIHSDKRSTTSMRISGIRDWGRWLTEDSNAQVIIFIKIPNVKEPTFYTFVSGTEAAALLATEQGQSFRRKFKGDFEETEGFCDSQGKVERFSTNNSLPVDAAESVGVSTSSTDGSFCTTSRTNAPGSSIQSTTNPAVEKNVNAGRKRADSTRTRDTALALPTVLTLPNARSNIDIEQVGVPFKCQKDQIISTPEGNFVKLNNRKLIRVMTACKATSHSL